MEEIRGEYIELELKTDRGIGGMKKGYIVKYV